MYELSNQSYDYKKTEFIMIDDHSTDNTFKLLCQYQAKKDNLIVCRFIRLEIINENLEELTQKLDLLNNLSIPHINKTRGKTYWKD